MIEPTTPRIEGGTQSSHRRAIERVILAMHHRLDSGLSMDEMARTAFISPFHFNRIFRQVVGIPPSHFLSALRIQMAKRLLASTGDRIIDICLDVGFTSPGTFSRRFKHLVGLPPRQFRRFAGRISERHLPRPAAHTPEAAPASALRGWVLPHADSSGPVFIGLFESPLPHSRPVSCCCLERPGSFSLAAVPDGDYYLLALGFPENAQPRDIVLGDTALRAGSTTRPVAIRGGRPAEPFALRLRPAEITDPPILLTLPYLVGC
jgi:AraC family transcriptional regulator